MTDETIKNPTASQMSETTSLDTSIKGLQTRLVIACPWIEKVFGRAYNMPVQVGDEHRTEPKCYVSGQEYASVLPNDALKSHSFFRVEGSREPLEVVQKISPMIYRVPLSIIVSGDLKEIDPSKDFIFTEDLINRVTNWLNFEQGVEVGKVFDEKADEIYSGYRLFPEHLKILMYPRFSFRVEFYLNYYVDCPRFHAGEFAEDYD